MKSRQRLGLFAGFALLTMGATAATKQGEIPFPFNPGSAEASEMGYTPAAGQAGDGSDGPITNLPSAAQNRQEDHTEALELQFEANSSDLPRDQEDTLRSFLRGIENHGRIRELKVITYASDNPEVAQQQQLARDRLNAVRDALAGEASLIVTYQVFPEHPASGEPAERNKADLLAVME